MTERKQLDPDTRKAIRIMKLIDQVSERCVRYGHRKAILAALAIVITSRLRRAGMSRRSIHALMQAALEQNVRDRARAVAAALRDEARKEGAGIVGEALRDKPRMPEGTYWDDELARYVEPTDDEWTQEGAEKAGVFGKN